MPALGKEAILNCRSARLFVAPIRTPDRKHKTCQVCGRSEIYLQTEYLPVTSSHYYTIGASDNNADCGGRYNTGWRDDDNNRVDLDSNSRWNNSRWSTLALRRW